MIRWFGDNSDELLEGQYDCDGDGVADKVCVNKRRSGYMFLPGAVTKEV
jgi:hypothetical protein